MYREWFVVAPSSVVPKGYGLYAVRDIPKGTLLPGGYDGHYLSGSQYIELLNELLDAHEAALQSREAHRLLKRIASRYGVYIKGRTPDWKALYKGLTDYAFEGSEGVVTVLARYTDNGRPVMDQRRPRNPYMFMNEPPPDPFWNRMLHRMQPNCVNVHPVLPEELGLNDSMLRFRTKRRVRAGEELFICYGGQYERPYRINMSSGCGCGAYDEVQGNVQVNEQRYLRALRRYREGIPVRLLTREAQDDDRIVQYMRKVHM